MIILKDIVFGGRLLNCETVCILGLVASVRREDETIIHPSQPHSKPMTSSDGPHIFMSLSREQQQIWECTPAVFQWVF